MANQTSPVDKIRLIDGTLVDLTIPHTILIPEESYCYVTWNITNFTGSVSLISGDDYQLNINEQRAN